MINHAMQRIRALEDRLDRIEEALDELVNQQRQGSDGKARARAKADRKKVKEKRG